MAYEAFYKFYEDRGFIFERSLLTTYCLSMFTKPFVILSGISGSGKSKIAQLFSAPARRASRSNVVRETAEPPLSGKWILMTVTDNVIAGDGRANLRYSDLGALLPADEIEKLLPQIEELKRRGAADNICDPFDVQLDGLGGNTITVRAYLQRASSPLLRLRFKSKRGEEAYDSTDYFRLHHSVGDVLKFEKVGERHLRLVSVNDKAAIETSELLAIDEANKIKNTLFVSVRSDWTDASYLFGYFNIIDQRYHMTPVLEFILRAAENPSIPFFLVLDEMNLAKVEHYFSDFLSCLESRRIDNGILEQEPIRLQAGLAWVETDDVYFDMIAPELMLPTNLFVTGTVNIDESTYMFSAKVLDRANVIELNDINLEDYESGEIRSGLPQLLLSSFPPIMDFGLASRADYLGLLDEAKVVLKSLHSILARNQLQFGYRVVNEMSRFVSCVEKYCDETPGRLYTALDYQILQKVLPKLSGPQSKLDRPFRELINFLIDGKGDASSLTFESIEAVDPSTCRFPRSVGKLQRMYIRLALEGFVTFVE